MTSLEAKLLSWYPNLKELYDSGSCKPRSLGLHISNRCNNKCDGCYFLNQGKDLGKFLDFESVKRVIDESIKDLDILGINFTGGGEPSMHPDFEAIVDYAIGTGKALSLISNGTWDNDALTVKIANSFTFVRIGLDCENSDMYYKITKNDVFSRVSKNIKNLVKNKINCTVGIKYLLRDFTCNVKSIQSMVDWGEYLGVDYMQFKPLYGITCEPNQEQLFDAERYLESIEHSRVKHNLRKTKATSKCIFNSMRVNVDTDGNVNLCPRFYHRRESHKLGNVHEKSLKDIWFDANHWTVMKNVKVGECNLYNCALHNATTIYDKYIINNPFHLEFAP